MGKGALMRRGDNFEPWWVNSRRGRGPARHRAIFTAIGTWLTATFGAFIAGVIGNLAVGAALIGVSSLLSAKKPQTSTPQAQAINNEAARARVRGYGNAKLGGQRAFWDSRDGTLFQIVMAHHGEISAFVQFYVGDLNVSRDSNGYVNSAPFNGQVLIQTANGSTDQPAYPGMMALWPGIWTAQHQLRGIASWFVRFYSPNPDRFQLVFPDGYNTPVTCVCSLSKVWDPRTPGQFYNDPTTWAWRDNSSLCIMDYLTHKDGFNLSIDDVDVPSFVAFADICDEPVALASGGTQPRYRLWGIYSLEDDPDDVLAKMRATCDGEFYQTPAGKIGIRGGKWAAPTVTISDQDILGHSMEQGSNKFSAFNQLKIIYTSAQHGFQRMEAPAWNNLADQFERGVLTSELTLDLVPSGPQARRLAKIHEGKSNPKWKGTIAANLSALDALGERVIRVQISELSIDDAFFVAGFSIRPDLSGVEISVISISEQSYLWDAETEELDDAPIPQDTTPDLSLPVPGSLALTEPSARVVRATVASPNRDGIVLQAQIRAGAGSLWQEMQVDPGTPLQAQFGPVAAGTYQVRARWRGQQNTAGEWTSPLAQIVIA